MRTQKHANAQNEKFLCNKITAKEINKGPLAKQKFPFSVNRTNPIENVE